MFTRSVAAEGDLTWHHTDSTPNLEGEDWLMHNGYTQAEGVANLDQVPEAGALVVIGYPKFGVPSAPWRLLNFLPQHGTWIVCGQDQWPC